MGKAKTSSRRDTEAGVCKIESSPCYAVTDTNEVDRISELPDDILLLILTSISIRDAAMFSVLSRRWKDLWKSLPTLKLSSADILGVEVGKDGSLVSRSRRKKFCQIVKTILKHHVGGVKIFHVNFFLDQRDASHLDKWFDFAVASGAGDIRFNLTLSSTGTIPKVGYEFPFRLLACRREFPFERIFLNSIALNVPDKFIGFNLLKVLHLESIRTTADDLKDLLSGCPVLESLELICCHELFFFGINHSHIKHLQVKDCRLLHWVRVSCINLIDFEFYGEPINIDLRDVPHLVSMSYSLVDVKFRTEYILASLQIFCAKLCKIQNLFFGFCGPIQKELFLGLPNKFTNVKKLTVTIYKGWGDDLLWLTTLLTSAPVLEEFWLGLSTYNDVNDTEEEVLERQFERCSMPPHGHIREVEIKGFFGYIREMEIVMCIVKIATALERMTINTKERILRTDNGWDSQHIEKERAKRARQKAFQCLLASEASSEADLFIL